MEAGYGGGKLGGARAADDGDEPADVGAAAAAPVAAAVAAGEAAARANDGESAAAAAAAAAVSPTMPLLCGRELVVPAVPLAADAAVALAAGGSPVPEKSALRGTVGLGAVTATGAGVVANTTEPPSEPWAREWNKPNRLDFRILTILLT